MSFASDSEIAHAVEILRAGGLVAFPTETVYGLGADASNPAALHRLYEAKGRPTSHPVIVHVRGASDLPRWAREVPPVALRLTGRFWPGPLTLVLKRAAGVLDQVTGGEDTVGLRVPAHPIAQRLLHAFGGGIAAPSANRFGRLSPTTAQHVCDELGDTVDLILDGGACEVGIESTIIDLSRGTPVLLRSGRISTADIEAATGVKVAQRTSASPRAPGTLAAHYAPRTPLILAAASDFERVIREQAASGRIAVLAFHPQPPNSHASLWQIGATDAHVYAHDLYTLLRVLDRSGCVRIVVEAPPERAEWNAVRDRLMRAATGSGGANGT
ncbi:MAG TPA: L-threonylcarbamoyladenylate synthase [Burkholderiales bacterium]|nr:L-threonylcarbamoyladenylate synthase [Burkholderiales bacterium]